MRNIIKKYMNYSLHFLAERVQFSFICSYLSLGIASKFRNLPVLIFGVISIIWKECFEKNLCTLLCNILPLYSIDCTLNWWVEWILCSSFNPPITKGNIRAWQVWIRIFCWCQISTSSSFQREEFPQVFQIIC